jgi:SAM-dependent methyltransferase
MPVGAVRMSVLTLAALGLAATPSAAPKPAASSPVAAQGAAPQRKPDIGFAPTMPEVVTAMLSVARVSAADVVYDLGCGDGRILIAAARQFGARGVGIEIDPALVKIARQRVRAEGVEDRVTILQQDLFQTDLRQATVVTLYLGSSVMLKLRPKLLRELKPGTRVVSHAFDMGDWKPDYEWSVPSSATPDLPDVNVFYWVIPPRGAPGK